MNIKFEKFTPPSLGLSIKFIMDKKTISKKAPITEINNRYEVFKQIFEPVKVLKINE